MFLRHFALFIAACACVSCSRNCAETETPSAASKNSSMDAPQQSQITPLERIWNRGDNTRLNRERRGR